MHADGAFSPLEELPPSPACRSRVLGIPSQNGSRAVLGGARVMRVTEATELWDEWKRITRFLNSTTVALARERLLWGSLELDDAPAVRLHVPAAKGKYVVRLDEHLDALAHLATLHSAVLIQSCAVAEAAACDRLGIDPRTAGGIEDWGAKLLAANGRSWQDVHGGLPGIVEVAVARNAYAHASHVLDGKASARLVAAGSSRWVVGDRIDLDREAVVDFRVRIRSLLRYGGFQPTHPQPASA